MELKDKLYSEDEDERAKASVLFPSSYFSEIELDENEVESFVLEDTENFEIEIIAKDLENEFMKLLTEKQKEVFHCVMLIGEQFSYFARR